MQTRLLLGSGKKKKKNDIKSCFFFQCYGDTKIQESCFKSTVLFLVEKLHPEIQVRLSVSDQVLSVFISDSVEYDSR